MHAGLESHWKERTLPLPGGVCLFSLFFFFFQVYDISVGDLKEKLCQELARWHLEQSQDN
jgi:hypothetical protein